MSDTRATASASRGWGWVLIGGSVAAVLATYPAVGEWLWWAFATVVAWLWSVPYVAVAVCVLAVVAAVVTGAALGLQAWKRRRR